MIGRGELGFMIAAESAESGLLGDDAFSATVRSSSVGFTIIVTDSPDSRTWPTRVWLASGTGRPRSLSVRAHHPRCL